ncbi:hypothetical protein NMY22_g7924 [Coprinellus aureogranulatus]|nr:hypothetical protein NMY22_g7924 [Coprinellus aureogranulatus]
MDQAHESCTQPTVVGEARCPVKDCTLPVDIILRSSDKTLIGAHRDNLAQFSEGFPSPDAVASSDVPVDLTEDGRTLEILMQFMHKQRFPSLQNETVDGLLRLGEAAEKYVVHSAMLACALRIRYAPT